MKKLNGKLALRKETVRMLTESEASNVFGGSYTTCTGGCGNALRTSYGCGSGGSCGPLTISQMTNNQGGCSNCGMTYFGSQCGYPYVP